MTAIKKYKLISLETLSNELKIFRFSSIDGGVPSFSPGQWCFLHLLDGNGDSILKRPYSIASSPSVPYLEFAIDMINGAFTSKLALIEVGAIVGIDGPYGHFSYKDQTKAAFIAGGTGLAPIMSMLRYIDEKKIDGSFFLFYSTKTMDRVLYRKELETIQAHNSGIKVVITLTREEPKEWSGETGRISKEMIAKYAKEPQQFDWWLCGHMELIKNMKDSLVGMGTEAKRLKMEGWG